MRCPRLGLSAFSLSLVLASTPASAQLDRPPLSLRDSLPPLDTVDTRSVATPDVAAVLWDDERQPGPRPLRVAVPQSVAFDVASAGTWHRTHSGRVWRLQVRSPGATFVSVKLDAVNLPAGVELFFWSPTHEFHAGPYDERHHNAARRLGSPIVPGESVVIEAHVPGGATDPSFVVDSVSHGFRDALGASRVPLRATGLRSIDDDSDSGGTGSALQNHLPCQIDINCPEGQPYQVDKRAVAETYDGASVCSGSMINNARQDCRYLFITAEHCDSWVDPATMQYYWWYENSGCGTHDHPPFTFSTGSTDLYHSAASDIQLLELDGVDLDLTYDIYFAGWSRSQTPPGSIAHIMHPDDKPKQIAFAYDPPIDCHVGPCGGGWGNDWWRIEEWHAGVPEGGSSGGGLLDEDHRLIGTLTGGVYLPPGNDLCAVDWDEFAQLYSDWANLAPFLDPDNTGVMFIDGKDNPTCRCSVTVDVQRQTPSPACHGADIVFQATVNGGVAPLSYQWLEDGVPLANGPDVSGADTDRLTIRRNVDAMHAYDCEVTDGAGNCIDIISTVSAAGEWEACCNLVVDVQRQTASPACTGDDIVFQVSTTGGQAPFNYEWLEDGNPLVDGPDVTGSVTDRLTISRAAAGTHSYDCRVTDASGNCVGVVNPTSATGEWQECCNLVVDVQRQTTSPACTGDDIVFQASTTGGQAPFNYEWLEDGNPLVDGPDVTGSATDRLTISRAIAGAHAYDCRVSDASGNCVDVVNPTSAAGEWQVCALPPPPVGDGVSGSPIRVTKAAGGDYQVTFDATTCTSDHAALAWGTFADRSSYAGTLCDLGDTGSATVSLPGGTVWFVLLWTNQLDVVGHPGFATLGPRTWTATGACGFTADDHSDTACD